MSLNNLIRPARNNKQNKNNNPFMTYGYDQDLMVTCNLLGLDLTITLRDTY
jgi:hypothetical protein